MSLDQHPIIEFPTNFRLRVIGDNTDDFATFVLVMVRRHVPDLTEDGVEVHLSHEGKYLSVIVSFIAESREQLDAIYKDLSSHKRVIYMI